MVMGPSLLRISKCGRECKWNPLWLREEPHCSVRLKDLQAQPAPHKPSGQTQEACLDVVPMVSGIKMNPESEHWKRHANQEVKPILLSPMASC